MPKRIDPAGFFSYNIHMRTIDVRVIGISRILAAILAALMTCLLLNTGFARAEADKSEPYPLLTLVNKWHPLPDGYEPDLVSIGDGHKIDSRAVGDFKQMMADCRAAGLRPVVRSSYRTQKKQIALYENKVMRLRKTGLCPVYARIEAATVVAYPGTSEHQLGLALDIVDKSYQDLETDQENTPVQKWLMQNSWRYGFILRYPTGKSDITGIIYEPWHYRYVGRGVAADVYASGLCFEEYVEKYISSDARAVPLDITPVRHVYAPFVSRF